LDKEAKSQIPNPNLATPYTNVKKLSLLKIAPKLDI